MNKDTPAPAVVRALPLNSSFALIVKRALKMFVHDVGKTFRLAGKAVLGAGPGEVTINIQQKKLRRNHLVPP